MINLLSTVHLFLLVKFSLLNNCISAHKSLLNAVEIAALQLKFIGG
jgi:hypothetical protein